jgi:hypothetical protein
VARHEGDACDKAIPQVADSLDDREQGSGFQHAVDVCDQFDAFAL